jgi:ferrous iron transport protein B
LFYAFAMQCMSTLAVVKRETGSWKWPLLQFGYLSALAWLSSFLVYQLLR